jgi:HSP20 family protein
MRARRGETFADEEVWYDRQTSDRVLLNVRCQAGEGQALIAFENVADQVLSMRLADLVASVGASLAHADDPPGLADAVLDNVAKAIGADAIFLLIAEPNGQCLRVLASLGAPTAFVQDRGAMLADTTMALAASTHEIQEVERIEDLPAGALRGTWRLLEIGLHSVVALPLVVGGELVGVLELARRQHGRLTALERRLLRGLAVACALGLRQAQSRAAERRETNRLRTLRMLRFDPFQEMQPAWSGQLVAYTPAFDVKETKDSFVFKADLPGLREQDIEVTATGNRLTVSGKREGEKEEKSDTYYTYERSFGSFSRSFTLPDHADVAHVKAELKDGEMTIVVPKSPAAVAKRIPVASGEKSKT